MKQFNVDLALKMNKLVHDECKDVPHDIGMKLACLVTDFLPVLNKTDCYTPLELLEQKLKEVTEATVPSDDETGLMERESEIAYVNHVIEYIKDLQANGV